MTGRPLRLLILEDSAEDAELALHELCQAGFDATWHRVDDEASFKAHLDPELDLVLADYHQPQFDAIRAFKLMREARLDIPRPAGPTGTATSTASCPAPQPTSRMRSPGCTASAANSPFRRGVRSGLSSAARKIRPGSSLNLSISLIGMGHYALGCARFRVR